MTIVLKTINIFFSPAERHNRITSQKDTRIHSWMMIHSAEQDAFIVTSRTVTSSYTSVCAGICCRGEKELFHTSNCSQPGLLMSAIRLHNIGERAEISTANIFKSQQLMPKPCRRIKSSAGRRTHMYF